MRLDHVRGEGFLSFRDKFEQKLADLGLVLVIGDNGAGKSALFIESILWAFFGETIREKVNPAEWKADKIINLSALKKGCYIAVKFAVSGKGYEILRARKHHEHGSGVSLREDSGQDISGESIRETNAKIETLIGMNFEAFTHSAIFAQNFKRFTQCTDAERRAILEEFQQGQVFTEARKRATDGHLKAQEKKYELLGQVDVHEGVISELDRQLAGLNSKLTDRQYHFEKETEEHEDKVKRTRQNIKEAMPEIIALNAKMTDAERRVIHAKTIVMSPDQRAAKVDDRANAKAQIQQYTLAINDADVAVRGLKKRHDHFTPGDACVECLRGMTGGEVTAYKKLIKIQIVSQQDFGKERRERLKEIRTLLSGIENTLKHDDAHRESYLTFQREWAEFERKRDKLESEIEILQERLKSLSAHGKQLRQRVDEVEEQIASVILSKNGNIGILKRARKNLTAALRRVDMHDFWLKGFGTYGVKEFMFKQALGFINERLIYFADCITAGEISVQLEINAKGKIEPVVVIYGGADSYIGASGGQEKRVDLCISLALQSLVEAGSQKCNIAVFDEFDGALDQAGLYMFIEFLKKEAEKKGSVVVMTHNTDLKIQFDAVKKIQHQDGVSKIESGI